MQSFKRKGFLFILLTQWTQFIEGTKGSRFTGYVLGADDGATTTFMAFVVLLIYSFSGKKIILNDGIEL